MTGAIPSALKKIDACSLILIPPQRTAYRKSGAKGALSMAVAMLEKAHTQPW